MDHRPGRGVSAIVLTFNSSASIGRTLAPLRRISDDIHVVDSFSTDDTVAICEAAGCRVVQHEFLNYSAQRNWAIDHLDLRHGWQIHVDADEEIEPTLLDMIGRLDLETTPHDAFIIGRKIVFMDKVLRFGGIARTWHLRLFRKGHGRCEDRLYDQHFVSSGRVGRLKGFMLDHQEDSLEVWTARHNRWSTLEAGEVSQVASEPQGNQVKASLTGDVIARKRYAKSRYYRLPLGWRVVGYTFYRYVLLLGFLDGRPGFLYHMLQAFWFRLLVDAKLIELQRRGRR